MTVHVRRIGTVTVLDLEGRVTEEDGADTYRAAVQRLVSDNQLKLVVNFQSVPYIDSAALGEVVRAYTTVTRRGGALKLLALPDRVRQVFQLTRLLSVFEHFETEAAAIESFDSKPIRPM